MVKNIQAEMGNVTNIEYSTGEETGEGDINDKKSIAYFKKSVFENGGFYFGRYEMGMPGQKSGDDPVLALSNEARNIKGTPVCVSDVMPWTNIDGDTAKDNLESMYNGEVQSAMLNNYAVYTAMNWLGEDLRGNFVDTFWPATGEDLYFKGNWVVINYSEILGQGEQTEYTYGVDFLGASPSGESVLLETGTVVKDGVDGREFQFGANNIYDLRGNAAEYMLRSVDGKNTILNMGGSFATGPSSGHIYSGTVDTTGSIDVSSRPILYK